SWQTATAYPLPASFWTQLHCLLTATKDPLTVGLNLRTGNLEWAQQMAKAATEAATNGLSFSIGNEPDLYGVPNYSSLAKPLPGGRRRALAARVGRRSRTRRGTPDDHLRGQLGFVRRHPRPLQHSRRSRLGGALRHRRPQERVRAGALPLGRRSVRPLHRQR